MSENMAGMHVVIAGGSGFIGHSLSRFLMQQGANVTIISRKKPNSFTCQFASWDGRNLGDWGSSLDGVDALVNLAGRTVNCIKTPDHQDEILRSRIESTRALGKA